MRKILLGVVSLWLAFAPAARATNVNIDGLPAATSVGSTDLYECEQSGANNKCTPTLLAAYLFGLASGDCTISGIGAVVCTKTNGVAFGSFATQSAPTGSTQCLHANSSGVVSGTGADCGSGSGAVSSVTGGVGVTVSPTTGAVVVSTAVTQRNNTGTTDALLSTDSGAVVTESNASPVAVGIAVASTTGFTTGNYWTVKNKGAGTVTITPTTSQIDGASSLSLTQNQSVDFYSDGTNYWTLPGRASGGGTTNTIASGALTLNTTAVGSASCGSAQTATATGVATTDVLTASFNGDPTAVTGYVPLTTGMLTIIAYPTLNTANFKVCNNTSASITPGAITLNWRVVR